MTLAQAIAEIEAITRSDDDEQQTLDTVTLFKVTAVPFTVSLSAPPLPPPPPPSKVTVKVGK